MSTFQIELDQDTIDALASLAASRGTAPADLVAEIVAQYVKVQAVPTDEPNGRSRQDDDDFGRRLVGISIEEAAAKLARQPIRTGPPPPDPIDALVGSIDLDPVDDIDEVIYGR